MIRIQKALRNLPIRWKLTLWSTFLIFILFASSNLLQYVVINRWTMGYEKQQLDLYMTEVRTYLTDPKTAFSVNNVVDSQEFLASVNVKHQLIRILDAHGRVLASVSRDIPENWMKPKSVSSVEYVTKRHWENQILIARAPVATQSFTGTIEIIRNTEIFDKFIDTVFLVMLVAGVGGLILSFLGGTIIAKQLLTKVQIITDTMHRIRQNGLMERVPISKNNDELAKLGILFNELMDDMEQSFMQQKQFVEDASHELRTPLAIIQGHLSMLNRWGKNDSIVLEKSLQASLKEVERLNGLVAELLELSRAESDQTKVAIEPASVDETIERAAKNFQVLHPTVSFSKQLKAEGTTIHMSARHLEQVIVILLDNAVKYSRAGQQLVRIESLLKEGNVHIRVSDKGIGIPAADLPFVLNRFYRVDKARTRKQGGNGLGLAIAKRLVNKYGGHIALDSVEGEGTTVSLSFPIL
ncbi:HAMP domain-containing sensor histidine kinase [Ectobacillus funiculus]|uniref:HAMP domain-containing sensor histidine kinase n=1 Tax=Ectobacillus funiculus TaxID=137993 RepID=UPI00101C7FD4|nr:HAMP domain-containing histidine kinase [Ectobacillus funiculus]